MQALVMLGLDEVSKVFLHHSSCQILCLVYIPPGTLDPVGVVIYAREIKTAVDVFIVLVSVHALGGNAQLDSALS